MEGGGVRSGVAERAHGYFSGEDDEQSDEDYVPPEKWKRPVRVGSPFQAVLPPSPDPQQLLTDSDDQLVWRPHPHSPLGTVLS